MRSAFISIHHVFTKWDIWLQSGHTDVFTCCWWTWYFVICCTDPDWHKWCVTMCCFVSQIELQWKPHPSGSNQQCAWQVWREPTYDKGVRVWGSQSKTLCTHPYSLEKRFNNTFVGISQNHSLKSRFKASDSWRMDCRNCRTWSNVKANGGKYHLMCNVMLD